MSPSVFSRNVANMNMIPESPLYKMVPLTGGWGVGGGGVVVVVVVVVVGGGGGGGGGMGTTVNSRTNWVLKDFLLLTWSQWWKVNIGLGDGI